MAILGYRPPAAGSPDSAILDADTALAYAADAPIEHGWLYAVAGRFSRPDAGTPTAQIGVYSTDAGGNPANLVGQAAAFAVSSATEAEFTRDLAAAVVLVKGSPRAFSVLATAARLRIGMAGTTYVPGADNPTFYWDDPSTFLHDPFDADRSSDEGSLGVWGLYAPNVAPDAPTGLAPGSTDEGAPALVSDLAPTFAGDFRDGNETLPNGLAGDTLKRARVQVYRQSTGALVWDSGAQNAGAAEVAARRFAIAYAGPALATGVAYRWRATVSDHLDAWSAVSGWRYFQSGAGRVDTAAATPVGKTDTRTPGPFVAAWRHSGGLATNAVEVKITNADSGATVRTGPTLAIAVANNGTISVAWAATTFAALPWDDERLVWWMRARDTAGAWSGWSGQAFWTNDPPHVPALYAPANNAAVTSYPLLQAACTDTDDAATALTVYFTIRNAAGAEIVTRTGAWNAGLGRYTYQVVAADFTSGFAAYLWDAFAFDGVVYSGGATAYASAQHAATRRVTYAQGPVPVITAPADGSTIATNTPTVTWTVAGQVSRTIRCSRQGVEIHRSTFASTSQRTYTLPALLSTGEQLHEGDSLAIAVDITDANGLVGTDVVVVALDYPTPPALQPSVVLVNGRGDLTPSVVKVTWPASTYPVDDFRYYRLARTISADMLAANPSLPDETVVFKRLEVGQTSYYDWEASSGIEYTYCLKQYVTQGADTLGSPTKCATVTVLFEATILHNVEDPESNRLVFDARRDRTITAVTDFAVVSPWNQGKPVQFEADVYYREVETEWVLAATSPQAANYDLLRLERMVQRGGILCYRDGRGNRLYGRFSTPPVVHDPPGGRLRTVRATFRELAYDPSAKD